MGLTKPIEAIRETELRSVQLDDKYRLPSGQVFVTGTQALVRLALMQRQRDQIMGLNTGGFISGYRGSPLGALDQQLWQARQHLDENQIQFQAGLNEDLAATAVWGTQQLGILGPDPLLKHEGVFGMWYGKGPGVDRSGDAFRHANLAGTHSKGGVLALAGDDHTCKSSTTTHQSEYAFVDAMIPIITPANVQEFIDFGLYGYALSRFSGCWVAMKCVAETIETSASISIDPNRIQVQLPKEVAIPEGGLNVRWYPQIVAGIHEQERRLHTYRHPAALAFMRSNRLDRVEFDQPKARLGIVTTGKSYLDIRQAMEMLGLDETFMISRGIKLYKVAYTYPMEPEGLKDFARGLDEIFVIEEKRPLMEGQIKDILFNLPANQRPRVVGKQDEKGAPLLWSHYEFTPSQVAQALGERLLSLGLDAALENRLAYLSSREETAKAAEAVMLRTPYFCSGCPHNSSTKVPEGSRAVAGIGCHFLSQSMDRNTATYAQMGGEGAHWMGQFAFTDEKHVFVNIGDGTYYHSGLLAIRAAVASGASMTYKILYNDAVAMTGGQPLNELNPQRILDQVLAEGVAEACIITDDLQKYPEKPKGGGLYHRDDLMRVQKEMRETEGVTVIIYEQTCAAEKRRRRKRDLMPDPAKRVFINPDVCEGCGDCGVASNCVSIMPLETPLGRKRQIDQSSCNKDFSCLKGFCPSFVTVEGGTFKKQQPEALGQLPSTLEVLEEPNRPDLSKRPFGIYVAGIGGTGVVTIGAILGMAAHLEGKGIGILDSLGLAQKGGAVVSHVRIGASPSDVHTSRIATSDADLILGCDMVTASQAEAMAVMEPGQTQAVLNSVKTFTGDFTRDPSFQFPDMDIIASVEDQIGKQATHVVDASKIATALLGDAIAANMFMLGFAYQKGLVPVSATAINQAISLNAVAVDLNQEAFLWGRRTAQDTKSVLAVLQASANDFENTHEVAPDDLDGLLQDRHHRLVAYQSKSYAALYSDLVQQVRKAERALYPERFDLSFAVAKNLYKIMAIKDEYEVARLHTQGRFATDMLKQFEGDAKLVFHMAPPLFSKKDTETGQLQKRAFGSWVKIPMRVLAKVRRIRGTALDPFGYTNERKMERNLKDTYVDTIQNNLDCLDQDSYEDLVRFAEIPEQIRGFGHVKEKSIQAVASYQSELLEKLRSHRNQT